MTYTTEQVIELVTEWIVQKSIVEGIESFPIWLKDKEFSQIPVKDQLIWVWDYDKDSAEQRYCCQLEYNHSYPICCFIDGQTSKETTGVRWWMNYSLTDPNKK